MSKFIDRCKAGEFKDRSQWTDKERCEYLASHQSCPIFGTIRKDLTPTEKDDQDTYIKLYSLPF